MLNVLSMSSPTCLPWRESKGHDVIHIVGVVGVGGVKGQRSAGSAPQVQQEGGVHHGNWKAPLPLPPTDGNVLRGPPVVALSGGENHFMLFAIYFTLFYCYLWFFRLKNSYWYWPQKSHIPYTIYSVLVSINLTLPEEWCRTRSWNKGLLIPAWGQQLSDSLPSGQTTPGCLSASCHCLQTEEENIIDGDHDTPNTVNISQLKGAVSHFMKLGFMIDLSQSVYSRWWSAHPTFGEMDRSHSMELRNVNLLMGPGAKYIYNT